MCFANDAERKRSFSNNSTNTELKTHVFDLKSYKICVKFVIISFMLLLFGGMAQWLGHRRLAGRLSLIYARSIGDM